MKTIQVENSDARLILESLHSHTQKLDAIVSAVPKELGKRGREELSRKAQYLHTLRADIQRQIKEQKGQGRER